MPGTCLGALLPPVFTLRHHGALPYVRAFGRPSIKETVILDSAAAVAASPASLDICQVNTYPTPKITCWTTLSDMKP